MEEQVWSVTSKYRIVSYVGSGVYGQVVRARLSSDLSKTVVIKRTSDVFRWGPGFAKYALREIAIMRRLNHPNVVKILDILKPEEGASCVAFAMPVQCQCNASAMPLQCQCNAVRLKTNLTTTAQDRRRPLHAAPLSVCTPPTKCSSIFTWCLKMAEST
jgi:serine/threonine protein kinase